MAACILYLLSFLSVPKGIPMIQYAQPSSYWGNFELLPSTFPNGYKFRSEWGPSNPLDISTQTSYWPLECDVLKVDWFVTGITINSSALPTVSGTFNLFAVKPDLTPVLIVSLNGEENDPPLQMGYGGSGSINIQGPFIALVAQQVQFSDDTAEGSTISLTSEIDIQALAISFPPVGTPTYSALAWLQQTAKP